MSFLSFPRPYRDDHEIFRESVRRFIADEILPHHEEWERQHRVSRDAWLKAGQMGLLLCAAPEEYGGGGGDFGHSAVIIEELSRVGATGPGFPLHSDVVAPYLVNYGTEAQKQEWLPKMARGEAITAIAMTEPGAGSDLAAIKTTAKKDGDDYVINGQKTFITNGHNADLIIVVAKTTPEAGRRGVSLFLVEATREGFSRGRSIEKIGQHAQDTAELFFENVRVPASNMLGEADKGFRYLMGELAQERMVIALRAAVTLEAMHEATLNYTRERKVFGQQVFEFQTAKYRLAEAAAEIAMCRTWIDRCLDAHLRRELTPEMAAAAKLTSTEMLGKWLDIFLQLHGGYGYTREYPIGRAWTDCRVLRIYGGSSEIMREIISRKL
ncbi:acyl-CoA dehydrogenase family protein [Rhodovulum sp. DZ06]|uniref:acyl-CoA dehydrogenase family protein n=1 Tax=Rhodovulum sp. DZ06 TaxID=3425126 RepID=UPI003D338F75